MNGTSLLAVVPITAIVSAAVALGTVWLRETITSNREERLARLKITSLIRQERIKDLMSVIEEIPTGTRRLIKRDDGTVEIDMAMLITSLDDQMRYVRRRVFPSVTKEQWDELSPLLSDLEANIAKVMDDFRSGKPILSFTKTNISAQVTSKSINFLKSQIDALASAELLPAAINK